MFFFRLRHLPAFCLAVWDLHRKHENEQVPAIKGPFYTLYAKWLDSLMASENAKFEQNKKLDMNRFQYTFFLSDRMCKSARGGRIIFPLYINYGRKILWWLQNYARLTMQTVFFNQ